MRHLTTLNSTRAWLEDGLVDAFNWSFRRLLEAPSDVSVHSAYVISSIQETISVWEKAHGNAATMYNLPNMCCLAQKNVQTTSTGG